MTIKIHPALVTIALCLAVASCAAPAPEGKADPSQTVSAMPAAPEGWSSVNRDSTELFAQGKTSEGIALLERFVAAYPDFCEAHFSLADSHLNVAGQLKSDDGTLTAERKQHLEAAARHFDRFHALSEDPLDRAQATRLLVQVHAADHLNRLNTAETLARRLLEELSGRSDGYAVLAGILRQSGRHGEGARLLHEGLAKAPAEERADFAKHMIDHVSHSPALSDDDTRSLLDAAVPIVDGQLRATPESAVLILRKAEATKAQGRIEKDAARKKALADEAERLNAKGTRLLLGK